MTLGTSDLSVSAVGVGAWAWGDRSGYWGSDWKSQTDKNLDAYRALLRGGVDFVDTAEVYGFGKSEELLRDFAREVRGETDLVAPLIATKFAPLPLRFTAEDVPKALKASLDRLGLEKTALYMQHWPAFGFAADAFNDGSSKGSACAANAVSATPSASPTSTPSACAPRRRNSQIAAFPSRPIRFSIPSCTGAGARHGRHGRVSRRGRDRRGVLAHGAGSPDGEIRRREWSQGGGAARGCVHGRARGGGGGVAERDARVGEERGKTPAQIAVNYCASKGAVPIPGAKDAAQAESVVGCLGWRLDEGEIAELEKAAKALPAAPGAPFEQW